MADTDIASIGRFSSQILTYFGTQRTVRRVTGQYENTFKYASGPTIYPSPGSVQQSTVLGVTGNISPSAYDSTRSYFLSRGIGPLYADSITALTIDIAGIMNITPQSLLEQAEIHGKLSFPPDAYRSFNKLRDPSHQIGTTTTVVNRNSLQAREIRA